MPAVTGALSGSTGGGSPISAIGISPQDDNYRGVGLQNGKVFGTSTGSATMVDITGASFPANPTGSATNKFVGRLTFDPANKDVAYVTFSFYAPAGQGVWKITNFGAATNGAPVAPVWSAAGNGIPSVPINAFAIDPLNHQFLFAGTDIGVYVSVDGGANWGPYGSGLPRVAVFDLSIQPTSRMLRAATHGRGMWERPIFFPTAATVSVSGRVLAPGGAGIRGAVVAMTDTRGNHRIAITNAFGYYSFDSVQSGANYVMLPSARRYAFSPRAVNVTDSLGDIDFTSGQ